MFEKHGLKKNLEKTKLTRVGQPREELNITLEAKDSSKGIA